MDKYCSEPYSHESCNDNAVLDCSRSQDEELQPILCEDVEIAVIALKRGRSAGVDNIPAKRIQAGGATMTDVFTETFNRICRRVAIASTQSLVITLPKRTTYRFARTTKLSASSVKEQSHAKSHLK